MRLIMRGLASVLALGLVGCGDSESGESGLNEPLRVQGAQFFEGSFPETHESGPAVTQINIRSTDLLQGNPAKAVSGLAGLARNRWRLPYRASDTAFGSYRSARRVLNHRAASVGPRP